MSEDTSSPEQWKRKYYDSLDEFEQKEKTWGRTEDTLRRALSRLSLAADGLLPSLDQQLVQLRSALRDKASSTLLNQRIEAMSDALKQLDQQKKQQAGSKPGASAALARLLGELKLPREQAGRAKQLQAQLSANSSDAWPEELLVETIALLGKAVQEAPGAPASGGLLTRLMPRLGKPAVTANQPDAAQPLLSLTEALKLPPTQQKSVNALKPRLDRADNSALQHLAQELAALWNSAYAGDAPSLSEALLQLLERLNLPGEMTTRVETLKERLERNDANHDWQQTLNDVANLIADMRATAQREKRDIEDFLQQVTANLQELDQSLRGSESSRQAAAKDSAALDLAVQDQVRGIENSVREATELSQLKLTIQQRLDAIRDHMGEYRNQAQQLHQETEAQMQALTSRLRNLENETEQLRSRVHEERSNALVDALTGIPNRLAYDERVAAEFARWKRFQTPLSLLVWDVDFFKRINDNYGHKAGDKVLTTIAETLHGQIRETDFIARYGGEEFVMLVTGADPAATLEVADKLRVAVAQCGFHFRGAAVPITISCGIAHFNGSDSPEGVFERADKALYQSKLQGRNRCTAV